jgi:hypothetical protein
MASLYFKLSKFIFSRGDGDVFASRYQRVGEPKIPARRSQAGLVDSEAGMTNTVRARAERACDHRPAR